MVVARGLYEGQSHLYNAKVSAKCHYNILRDKGGLLSNKDP